MKTITLPTENESLIELTIGNDIIQFDILDYETMYNKALDRCKLVGELTSEVFTPSFIDVFYEKFAIKLSVSAASMLLVELNTFEDEFKKKFSDVLDSSDSTVSPPED